jgi:hypothetical protein
MEPVSLETPIGEEEDSHLGDFLEDKDAMSPSEYASNELKDDESIVSASVRHTYIDLGCKNRALDYASNRLATDENILFEALKYDESILDKFPYNHRFEQYFMSKAVRYNGLVILKTSEELKTNYDLVLAAARENGIILSCGDFAQFRSDREIALAAIISNCNVLPLIPEEFKQDKQFVIYFLIKGRITPHYLREIPEEIRNSKEVILAGYKGCKDLLLSTIESGLINDQSFLIELIKNCGDNRQQLKFIYLTIQLNLRKTGSVLSEKFVTDVESINPTFSSVVNDPNNKIKTINFDPKRDADIK